MSETTTAYRHPNLPAALAAFQAELPVVQKGNTAQVRSDKGNYSYDYADLSDISPVVLPLLGAHGLSWTTSPTIVPDLGFVLTYELLHESGETREGIYPLPAPNTPAQQLGSAITYARRYTLCAVTGVAPGGDDDDAQSVPESASRGREQQGQQKRQQPPIRGPRKASRDWIADANKITDLDALTDLANEAQRLGELGLKAGEGTVIDALQARRAQLEAPPLDVDLPKQAAPKGRQWVREARAMTTWPEVRALFVEAKAARVSDDVLRQIQEFGESLPESSQEQEPAATSWPTVREPGSGWVQPGDGDVPADPPMALSEGDKSEAGE